MKKLLFACMVLSLMQVNAESGNKTSRQTYTHVTNYGRPLEELSGTEKQYCFMNFLKRISRGEKSLLEQINTVTPEGFTPLDIAISRNISRLVRLLCKNGANTNHIVVHDGKECYSPLHRALMMQPSMWAKEDREENYKIVKALVENGADVNYDSSARNPVTGQILATPLDTAIVAYSDIDKTIQDIGPSEIVDKLKQEQVHLKQKITLLLNHGAYVHRMRYASQVSRLFKYLLF